MAPAHRLHNIFPDANIVGEYDFTDNTSPNKGGMTLLFPLFDSGGAFTGTLDCADGKNTQAKGGEGVCEY